MENNEKQDIDAQGALNDKLMAMFANYENSQSARGNGSKPTRQNLLAKYFTPRNRTEYFRILPPLSGREYIETAYFHVVKVNDAKKGKRWKKIYCPAHNERVPKKDAQGNVITDKNGNAVLVPAPCPLCKKHKEILDTQDKSILGIKKEDMTPNQLEIKERNYNIWKDAIQWEAKKFYIIRGIDKMQIKDGVKFWRFKHNRKQQGVQDKLVPVLGSFVQNFQVDFSDIERGSDLQITVVDSQTNSGIPYKDVSSVIAKPPSKLHEDPILVQQWVNDPITWRDVFKAAKAPHLETYEYMERLLKGVDPYWDDTDPKNKKWIYPDPADTELQEKANTRDLNLDADNTKNNVEMASDVYVNYEDNSVNISNVTANDVGKYSDDAVDMGSQDLSNGSSNNNIDDNSDNLTDDSVDNYDDLPF